MTWALWVLGLGAVGGFIGIAIINLAEGVW